jgi:hypothetical protein
MSETQDVTITRIREVRHRISEQYGHDPQKLVRHYIELQKKFSERLLWDEIEEKSEAYVPMADVTQTPA